MIVDLPPESTVLGDNSLVKVGTVAVALRSSTIVMLARNGSMVSPFPRPMFLDTTVNCPAFKAVTGTEKLHDDPARMVKPVTIRKVVPEDEATAQVVDIEVVAIPDPSTLRFKVKKLIITSSVPSQLSNNTVSVVGAPIEVSAGSNVAVTSRPGLVNPGVNSIINVRKVSQNDHPIVVVIIEVAGDVFLFVLL